MFKPRSVVIAAGTVCAGVFIVSRMDNFKTPGVRNIENRHSAAGGGHSHTPAGGSPLGKEDQVGGRQLEEKGGFELPQHRRKQPYVSYGFC